MTEIRNICVYCGSNVGTNPTFDGVARRVEAYVLDAPDPAGPDALDLYGEPVAVEFVTRLRAMVRFDGVDALLEQMRRDAEQARLALR